MSEKFEGDFTNGENQESKKPFDLNKPLVVSDFDYGRYREDEESYKLFEFEGDPRYVVRIADTEGMQAQLEDTTLSSSEALHKVKGLFDELREKYHIIAPVDFAIVEGLEDKKELLYIITDKVEGEHPEKVDFDSPDKEELVKKFEGFYLYLTRYFIDKFKSDEPVLWDIAKSSAIKYGKKQGDASPDLYIVDTDIKLTPGSSGIGDLTDAFETIQLVESKCEKKFDSVRKELADFIDYLNGVENSRISENHLKDVIRYIKAFLGN